MLLLVEIIVNTQSLKNITKYPSDLVTSIVIIDGN